jgi:RNA polymerase sigma-70 factor (ECF subfamily)
VRPFALSLIPNVDPADDLIQDTILRAWKGRESFQSGTNLPAWVFTSIRDRFYT